MPDTDTADMDHGDGAMMGGMMTDGQMGATAALTGVEFDMFAQSMIAHHEGAVDAAKSVLEDGASEDVRQMAEAVIEAQTTEIQQLTTWIAERE